MRGVAYRGSPVIGGLECARPYGMAWITTMVPRVAAKMTESKRKLVSLDTVDVLVRCARTMYQAVGAATKPMMTTKPNGGMPMSTLIPINARLIMPTTTAVGLNALMRLHDQSRSERVRPIILEIFIDSTYVQGRGLTIKFNPRLIQN